MRAKSNLHFYWRAFSVQRIPQIWNDSTFEFLEKIHSIFTPFTVIHVARILSYICLAAPMLALSGNQSAVFQPDRRQRMHSISFLFQTLTREGTLLRIHSAHSSLSSRYQGAILRRESAVFQLSSHSGRLEFSAEIAGRAFSVSLPPLQLNGHSADFWNFVAVKFLSHSLIRVTVRWSKYRILFGA